MGVTAEVVDDLFGTAEGLFGVDDPVVLFRLANELARLVLGEIDLAGLAQVDEAVEELAAKRLSSTGRCSRPASPAPASPRRSTAPTDALRRQPPGAMIHRRENDSLF